MKLQWHKVTWYSKTIALAIFIVWPFIFFYFGVIYGTAQQFKNDALTNLNNISIEPATHVVRFIPSTLINGIPVASGSCWTNSIAAPLRADAWRCTVGNNIQDPCFEIANNAKTLLCTKNPADPASSLALTLTKPLPKPGEIPTDLPPAAHAWLIKLGDGTTCTPFTGTLPFTDKGEVAHYGCTDKRLIFGDINTSLKTWTAKAGMLSTDPKIFPPTIISSSTVSIATVWE